VRSRRRSLVESFRKVPSLVLLAVPLLWAAQTFQESNGIIEWTANDFPRESSRKAEWSFVLFIMT